MLEESKMDKKSQSRTSQQQPRASAVDCKKPAELPHKPWPRIPKKREGPNNISKNVPVQRGRGPADRRPRPRGNTSFNVGGTANTGVAEDDEPEIGSVFVPGSKKQNLNHLLNFMYPSRGGSDIRDRRAPPVRRHGQQRVTHRHEHDLYLRSYCQFVVKEEGNYKTTLLDPDVPLKWEQIEEVLVRSTGRSECPICLGIPSAGRIGLCGHVYCWACALHYGATHDKQPPPCPVCATPLHVKEMKPARMVQWKPTSEEVTMRLVRRLRGSTVVEIAPPRGQLPDKEVAGVLPLHHINTAPYSKLFAATKQQVFDILERERKEIQDQIMAEIDTTELVYLEQALQLLKEKEDHIKHLFEVPKLTKEVTVEDAPPTVVEKHEINENKLDWFDVTDEGAAFIDNIQNKVQELNVTDIQSDSNPLASEFNQSDVNDNPAEEFPLIECPSPETEEIVNEHVFITDIDKKNQAKYFYFYQAEDGQQVFLNSLNVRLLNASWGALAAAPPLIRGRVLNLETISLTEQTRKHMPFTTHLPLHCSFDIVELDLQPPYVTPGALKCFTNELERRARARARRERDEKRRERAYRRATASPPKPDFSSEVLFPTPTYNSPPLPEPSVQSLEQASPSTSTTTTLAPSPSGLSFAKMASSSGTWRVRKTSEPPTPPPEEEPFAPRSLNLSDAIEAALHAAPSTAGKKNKKAKQKVLFATGMHRAG